MLPPVRLETVVVFLRPGFKIADCWMAAGWSTSDAGEIPVSEADHQAPMIARSARLKEALLVADNDCPVFVSR